ncbi:VOC family protein [Arenibaculum pallidiluteum]|uniref:VOC family protein n=1 Tax=Arenibaculum pallidiluteum TaxID=2812559 RepID=UPI001A965F5F|nr:VOC family protein [Arenibaculum pallidiluteum]
MLVQPYLFFEGRAEEALDFYRRVLGAEVTELMRFKDAPEPCPDGAIPPGSEAKVMHAAMRIGESTVLVSDGRCAGKASFEGFSLTLQAKDEAEAGRVFAALGDGGTVVMPLGRTFFAPCFGMVADRFGLTWMVIVPV